MGSLSAPLSAGVKAEGGVGADPAEGVERLAQDLLPVGDEEDALRAEANGVECGEPGLSKSGGEHDKARGVAFGAGARGLRGLGQKQLALHRPIQNLDYF